MGTGHGNSVTRASNTTIGSDSLDIDGDTAPPSNYDDALAEFAAQLAREARDSGGANTVGGTADAIEITLNDTTVSAYFDGMWFGFRSGGDNTITGATLNAKPTGGSLIGAKTIKKASASDGTEAALAVGDIQSGGFYLVVYRSAWASAAGAWQLVDMNHPAGYTADDNATLTSIYLNEQAAAAADVAGDGQLWVKSDTPNTIWFTDDAGTDYQIATLTGTETLTNKSIDAGQLTGDVAVADGGTGASDASTARTNLGLAIGSDVQAYDAGLADIAGLAVTDSNFIVGDGANWTVETGATARTSLGLGSLAVQSEIDNTDLANTVVTGLTEQASPGSGDFFLMYDTGLTALRKVDYDNMPGAAGFPALDEVTDVTITTPATGEVLAKSAGDWINQTLAEAGIQAQGDVLDDLNALGVNSADSEFLVGTGAGALTWESGATVRTSLGLTIGTDVQAYDAGLADVAGLAVTDGNFIVGDGANWTAESGATARASLGVSYGKETIWIPANAFTPTTTNGAESTTEEQATNDVMVSLLLFDASTRENACAQIQMPKSWNEGTVIAQFVWKCGATTGNCIWGIEGVALANDDPLDTAFGTAQEVTDGAGSANDDVLISGETSAMTVAGSPGASELLMLKVYRDAADGSDTLAVDAELIGVKLIYTVDAANDD